MTNLVNTKTNEITTTECIIDGVDILADVMGGMGVSNGIDGFELDNDDEIDWWVAWAEREERINAAREDAIPEQLKKLEEAVSEYGYDLEALQELECEILSIEY